MDTIKFKPFDRVLVRDSYHTKWEAELYSDCIQNNDGIFYNCVGHAWRYCIPYNEETAHLLGTTNDYIPEEPKLWTVKDHRNNKMYHFNDNELKQFIETKFIEEHAWYTITHN